MVGGSFGLHKILGNFAESFRVPILCVKSETVLDLIEEYMIIESGIV